jgi:hypothetical protein
MLEENEDVFIDALKQDLNKPVQVNLNLLCSSRFCSFPNILGI